MRNTRASLLCCCLAALPLAARAVAPEASPAGANVAETGSPRIAAEPVVYTGPATPAAVLVFVPGESPYGGASVTPASSNPLSDIPPSLWADQGLGVVTPRITDVLLNEEREADLALRRMLAYARAMADAPIWLVGSAPEVRSALERLPAGRGTVSGIVITSVSSPAGTCSQTVVYSNRGVGGVPAVQVRSSGDACGTISPGARPPVFEQVPQPSIPFKTPRLLLVRSEPRPASGGATVRRQDSETPMVRLIADRIKQPAS